MRATILPYAIILTKAHRAAVSIIAKGCMWSEVLGASTIPSFSGFFLLFALNNLVTSLKYSLGFLKYSRYSQTAILHAAYFRRVVNEKKRLY